MDTINFGQVINELKQGRKLSRQGWWNRISSRAEYDGCLVLMRKGIAACEEARQKEAEEEKKVEDKQWVELMENKAKDGASAG